MDMVDNPPYKNPTFLVDDRMKLILFVPVLARVYSYMYVYIFIYTFIHVYKHTADIILILHSMAIWMDVSRILVRD